MKIKLPILIGTIYLLLSLPFIFGYLQPSLHEGGYSAIYVMLNLPALMVVSGIVKKIETTIITDGDLYTSNLIAIALLLFFWIAVSFILGTLIDEIKKHRKSRHA